MTDWFGRIEIRENIGWYFAEQTLMKKNIT